MGAPVLGRNEHSMTDSKSTFIVRRTTSDRHNEGRLSSRVVWGVNCLLLPLGNGCIWCLILDKIGFDFGKDILHFQKYVNRPCMYVQLLVLNFVKFGLDLLVSSGSNLPLPIQNSTGEYCVEVSGYMCKTGYHVTCTIRQNFPCLVYYHASCVRQIQWTLICLCFLSMLSIPTVFKELANYDVQIKTKYYTCIARACLLVVIKDHKYRV